MSRRLVGFFVAVLGATAFIAIYPGVRLGILFGGAHSPQVVPIRDITDEVHLFHRKDFYMGAWIHNIHVGQVVGLHHHPVRPEMVAILRGKARVRGLRRSPGGPVPREEILGPGNIVFSPPTSIHGYENVGDEPLWCFVVQSPPFDKNHFLDGAPPHSDLDFVVLPWRSGGALRGEAPPDWTRALSPPWHGEIGFYPGIPGSLRRDPAQLAGGDAGAESWLLLLSGDGILRAAGRDYLAAAPTWVRLHRGAWTLGASEKSDELVVLEYRLPPFEPRLYARGVVQWWSWRLRERLGGLLGSSSR